ncbi:class II aldolase/adducin family protein [uncultured Propionivibrio sp.]|uniref:class II aldolase/adducin family protein n=1 Tax=uncultured Propionivibrio sp. TaxID=426737 RepID=UPI0029C056E0|nr:class II aldolase/adducin family protein [uncultured Propionivibrio sp.]
MNDLIEKAIADFILAARRAYDSRIQTGNGGNLSVRIGNTGMMVVKASGVSFVDSAPDTVVVTDLEGRVLEGNRSPTRELLLHSVLYREFGHFDAIVHTHSPYAIVWSLSGKDIPPVTKQSLLKLPGPIPVVAVDTPEVTTADIPKICALLKEDPKRLAFVLQGHGIVALGRSAPEAEHLAEFVEETAQIAWLAAIGRNAGLIA